MLEITKRIAGAVAATAMMATMALSESDANPVPAMPGKISSEPLSFSTQSAAPSSFIRGPNWMIFALTFPFDSQGTTVIGGIGVEEGVLRGNNISGGRLEFGWEIAAVGSSLVGSASSSFFGGVTPYFVLGAVVQRDDITYLTRAPNLFFSTNGSSDFFGVYSGLNILLLGDPIASSAAASSAVSSFGGFSWMVFANAGYGNASVDAFGGSFSRDADGLFFEAGSRVLFNLGLLQAGPGVTYRFFDNGPIKIEDTLWTFDFLIPFGQ